jgi:hypothetical protein
MVHLVSFYPIPPFLLTAALNVPDVQNLRGLSRQDLLGLNLLPADPDSLGDDPLPRAAWLARAVRSGDSCRTFYVRSGCGTYAKRSLDVLRADFASCRMGFYRVSLAATR